MIREIVENDRTNLLVLYKQLGKNIMPRETPALKKLWHEILEEKNHHIIVADENGQIISSCVCVIVPNLTHEQRPYALIENVITDKARRRKGLATVCLNYAKTIARKNNCYKLMLLTGAKTEGAMRFYEAAGFNKKDKTAFVQWLDKGPQK